MCKKKKKKRTKKQNNSRLWYALWKRRRKKLNTGPFFSSFSVSFFSFIILFSFFFSSFFFFSFLIQSKRILHHISTSRLCFQRHVTTKYIQCTIRQRYRGRFGVYIIIYRSYRQRGTLKLYVTTQLNVSCCREKAHAGRRADMHTTTKQPSNAIKQQRSDRRETSQHTHARIHTHTVREFVPQ